MLLLLLILIIIACSQQYTPYAYCSVYIRYSYNRYILDDNKIQCVCTRVERSETYFRQVRIYFVILNGENNNNNDDNNMVTGEKEKLKTFNPHNILHIIIGPLTSAV